MVAGVRERESGGGKGIVVFDFERERERAYEKGQTRPEGERASE